MNRTGYSIDPVLRHRDPLWRTMALLALAVSVLALVPAMSEQSDAAPEKCGNNVYYEATGSTLRITGSGPMYDYDSTDAPWTKMFMIESVVIDYGVTHIGDRAFYGSWMETVSIPSSVTSIGEKAFSNSSLNSITLPSSVKTIGEGAFSRSAYIKSVSIPNGVAVIEDETFRGCSALSSVSIPSSVKTIGEKAFYGCLNLTNVAIPASVSLIGEEAFSKSGLGSVTVPDSVSVMGDGVFSGCRSLETAVVGNSVKAIPDETFYGCLSLTSVKLGGSVAEIGEKAFYWCSFLGSVDMPGTVTTVDDMAFYGCMALASAGDLGSVKSFGEGSFYGCPVSMSASVPAKARAAAGLGYDGLPDYSELEPAEKRLYDAVAAAIEKGTGSSVKIPSEVPENELMEYALTVMEKVHSAIKKDYRQAWDDEDGYDFLYNVNIDPYARTFEVDGGKGFDRSSYDKTVSALRGVKVDGSSRYAQVKDIHDYVCDLITYNYADTTTHKYHCIYNAVLGDHRGVCESYAAVFKMLCDIHGIPCVYVAGLAHAGDEVGHAWNFVRMEDGNWYFVDPTWDDTGGSTSYFLRGSAAMSGRVVTDIVYPAVYAADYKAPSTDVHVTGITLDRSSLTLGEGGSHRLTASIVPSDASLKEVDWMTSDPKVATVDQDGNVKAVSPGKATITAVSVDMAMKAYCEVTVQSGSVPVTGVDLDRSSASMVKGGSFALSATVKPANATDRSVSWSSSDTSVATVDQDGNVKAVSAGSATVTVTTRDGSKTAVCEISVRAESVPAKNIRLSQSSASLYEGGSIQLIATLTPSDSTDTVAWKSSNTGVATVDQDGNVKAVSAGTATISATSGGGYVTSSCMVTVKQGGKPVTGISLNADTLYLNVGGSSKLTATTYPSDASVRDVNWASDNAGVATVDQDGNVKAVAPGKAKITATSVDGGFEASCGVTVQSGDVQVTGITLDRSSLTLGEGGSHRLTATIVPSDASLKEVDWMTSDPKVATVDQDGNVKAVSPGKATITAVSVDMAMKAYCEVTVENGSQGGSSSNLLLYAAAGIVGIVAILGAALFLRGRGS